MRDLYLIQLILLVHCPTESTNKWLYVLHDTCMYTYCILYIVQGEKFAFSELDSISLKHLQVAFLK